MYENSLWALKVKPQKDYNCFQVSGRFPLYPDAVNEGAATESHQKLDPQCQKLSVLPLMLGRYVQG